MNEYWDLRLKAWVPIHGARSATQYQWNLHVLWSWKMQTVSMHSPSAWFRLVSVS